ncbi:hypothetical protein KL940_003223 [Ogataea angusta]|uniref:Uncharacterized protein n=1 Tax=Pichia angusta TaxID=870730 RepID=A0ABQ7RUY2_PICAN|nr:hypothetical protein KL940_003223 [Ogataea angusta]
MHVRLNLVAVDNITGHRGRSFRVRGASGLEQPAVDRRKLVVVHHLVLENAADLGRGQHGLVLAVLREVQRRKQHEELDQVAALDQQHDVRLLEYVYQFLALGVQVLDQFRVERREVRSAVQHHLGEAVGDHDDRADGVLLEQVLPVVEGRLEVLERGLERLLELQRVVQREQDRELADDAAVEARRRRDVEDVAALVEPQRVDQARPAREDAVAQVRERELVPEPETLDAVRVHLEPVRQQVEVHLARDVVQQRVARQKPAVEVERLVRERDGEKRNQQKRLDLVLGLRHDEQRRREQPLDRVEQRARKHVHVLGQAAAVEAEPQHAQHGEQQRALRAQLGDVVVRDRVDAAPEAVEVDGEPHELVGERLGQHAAGDDVGVGRVREHERPDAVRQLLVEGDLRHVAGAAHVPERRHVEVQLVEQVRRLGLVVELLVDHLGGAAHAQQQVDLAEHLVEFLRDGRGIRRGSGVLRDERVCQVDVCQRAPDAQVGAPETRLAVVEVVAPRLGAAALRARERGAAHVELGRPVWRALFHTSTVFLIFGKSLGQYGEIFFPVHTGHGVDLRQALPLEVFAAVHHDLPERDVRLGLHQTVDLFGFHDGLVDGVRHRERVYEGAVVAEAAPPEPREHAEHERRRGRARLSQLVLVPLRHRDARLTEDVHADGRQVELGPPHKLCGLRVHVDVPLAHRVVARGVQRLRRREAKRAPDNDHFLHFAGQLGVLDQGERQICERAQTDDADVARVPVDGVDDQVARHGDGVPGRVPRLGGQLGHAQVAQAVGAVRKRVARVLAHKGLVGALPDGHVQPVGHGEHFLEVLGAGAGPEVARDRGDGPDVQVARRERQQQRAGVVDARIAVDNNLSHKNRDKCLHG